jgi:glucan phosphorylase
LSDVAESLVDSLATLELPAWGYGLRFKYGNLQALKKGNSIKISSIFSGAS